MISKDSYVKLVEGVAEAYSSYCMALEALGLQPGDEGLICNFVDKVLEVAAAEAGEGNLTELIERADIEVRDPYYWSPDMPLTIHFAWNLNFGDGGFCIDGDESTDGGLTTIVVEGKAYELATAGDVWECLNHLNQLRAHYGCEAEPMYEGDAAYEQLIFGEGYGIIYM